MKAPLKQSDYPRYFKTKCTLLAFIGPKIMYKIEAIGSNMNDGITIDQYITRNMVLRHWPSFCDSKELTKTEFRAMVAKLYQAYIDKMTIL